MVKLLPRFAESPGVRVKLSVMPKLDSAGGPGWFGIGLPKFVLAMPALYDPNILVFALKGARKAIAWRELRERAAELESRLGLPFSRYVSRLRTMNRWNASELIISP